MSTDSPLSLARGLFWLARRRYPEPQATRLARVGWLRAQDWEQEEIAQFLGCTQRTVRNRERTLATLLEAVDGLPLPRPIPPSASAVR